MNDTKSAAYAQAASYSFTLQAKQKSFPVKPDEPTTMPLGIQPFGITSVPFEDGVMVAMANYNAPAQHVGKITVADGVLTRRLARVSGAMHGPTWRRGGFPDIDTVAQANRCWAVALAPNGNMLVGRGHQQFVELAPPVNEGRLWRAVKVVVLPQTEGHADKFIASAVFARGVLFTVEHDADYNCEAVQWELNPDGSIKGRVMVWSLGKFRYGIALAKVEGPEKLVTVTPYHTTVPAGVYVGKTLQIPGIFGDGICPAPDGGALITLRGMESPNADSLEEPGALIYIPPAMFPKGFEWVR